MKISLFFWFLMSSLSAFAPANPKPLDIQGHRGCRGLMPENTVPAFIKALDLGVTTLEMDAVITRDNQVILSHEPFLSHEICLSPEGKEITEASEKSFNLYQMSYEEVKRCDCGSKPHPRFPSQQKMVVHKPLLSSVIDSVEAYLRQHSLPRVQYNIETKSDPKGDGTFHPAPEEFVSRLMAILKEKDMLDRVIIQSFDVRTLQVMHKQYPRVRLALLIENQLSPEENLNKLGFTPTIYSPDFSLTNAYLINFARKKGMQVIPWTANEPADIRRMIALGVDGIISDYPDRVIQQTK
jgi:glycerophosphoryl diester phosphodiesterase